MADLPQPQDFGSYGEWAGREVLDADGKRVGTVEEIYLDEATDRPEWVLVGAGDGARIVPLADATIEPHAIRVAQPAERIGQAPALDPGDTVDRDQERRLYAHYGLRYSDEESSSGLPAAEPEAVESTEAEPTASTGELGRADARKDLEGATEPAAVRPVPSRLRRYRAPEPVAVPPAAAAAPPPAAPPPPVPPPPVPDVPSPGPLDRLRPVAPLAGALLALVGLLALVRRRRDR